MSRNLQRGAILSPPTLEDDIKRQMACQQESTITIAKPTEDLYEMALRNGFQTIVDEDVYYQIRLLSWRVLNTNREPLYVCGNIHGKRVLLHRWIVSAPKGMMVDHINGNPLDNRRENLRVCTNSQNQANRSDSRGSSEYKGVSLDRETGRWVASICKDGESIHLVTVDCEEEAAYAYNVAARELFGEFACLNLLPSMMVPRKPIAFETRLPRIVKPASKPKCEAA